MDCRHVWSLPSEYATVAYCLRCGEPAGLKKLLEEGLKSSEEPEPFMSSPQVLCHCGLVPLQGFGTAIKEGVRHTAERCGEE